MTEKKEPSQKAETFKRILVPVDGSDSAKKAAYKALSIAKNMNIPITAVYVVDTNVFTGTLPPDQSYNHLTSILEQEGNDILSEIEQLGSQENVKTYTMLLKGIPDQIIIEEADKNDLIVMGGKGKTALDRIFLGSVSEKVLHHAKSHVLIIR